MNVKRIIPLIAALSFFLNSTASADQYKTIKPNQSIATDSQSLIEITARGTNNGYLEMKLSATGETISMDMTDPSGKVGNIVTGMSSIKALGTWVIVKITPAEETIPTQPTNVAVIPNDANGQYQVILESSVDMVTWNPVNPGNYAGSTPSRFFRTRIVKLP